jgi:hypothetical protein
MLLHVTDDAKDMTVDDVSLLGFNQGAPGILR